MTRLLAEIIASTDDARTSVIRRLDRQLNPRAADDDVTTAGAK